MNPSLIVKICQTTEDYLERALRMLKDEDGGWLFAAAQKNSFWVPCLHLGAGNPSPEKEMRFCENSLEKCRRLILHPEHYTSRESRNEAAFQFGGAIRTLGSEPYILSFSGLPEEWDEALMLAVSFEHNLLSGAQIRAIASPEVYEIFNQLLAA